MDPRGSKGPCFRITALEVCFMYVCHVVMLKSINDNQPAAKVNENHPARTGKLISNDALA